MLTRNIKAYYSIAKKHGDNRFLAFLSNDPQAGKAAADRIIKGVVGLADYLTTEDPATLADSLIEAAGRAAVGRPVKLGCLDGLIADVLEAAAVYAECSQYAQDARQPKEEKPAEAK